MARDPIGVVVNTPHVPAFAAHRPTRAVELHDDGGLTQVLAWDLDTGRRQVRTAAPNGVSACDIEPDGRHFWWFDADRTGVGVWRRQPVDPDQAATGRHQTGQEAIDRSAAGPPPPALTGLPPGRQHGIAFDATGRRAAVCLGTGRQTRCYVGEPGGPGHLATISAGYTTLVDLTADGHTIALAARPDSATAVSVVRLTDGRTDTVAGSDQQRIWALEFRPGERPEPELLIVVETPDRYQLGTWRRDRGVELSPGLSYDSEVTAHWYGDDGRILVQHDRAGRSRLLLADLQTGEQTTVATPPGTILDLTAAPDGAIHYVWTRDSVPPRRLVAHPGTAAPHPARRPRPAGRPAAAPGRTELWTDQPYGRIHSFLATPPGTGPWPTLFLLHGGPYLHDRDAYDPRVDLLVRAGYAVARANYRASTGYGPRWRRDFDHRVGLAQLEDLAAVRRKLIDLGVAEPGRIGLCGYSWGGYLVLLAMGVAPSDWAIGLAVCPIADYPAAYRGATAALRDVDDELFGGGPDDVPQRYHAADPTTYLDRVRGPLFIAAATDDERCPPDQIRRYVAALRHRRVPHQLHWMPGGHHGDAAGQTRTFDELLRYADTVFTPTRCRDRTEAGRPKWTVARS